MQAKFISQTQIDPEYLESINATEEFKSSIQNDVERLIVYVARVSSPNQTNESYENLIKYCIKKGHWSVFESASMTIEVETSRMISPQILRHRSFTFQEFSQRYSKANGYFIIEARLQDETNRQNSIETDDVVLKQWWSDVQHEVCDLAFKRYEEAIEKGIAKEVARNILPLATKTKLYVTGNLRSWIHYIAPRSGVETQKEHREIAEECRKIFVKKYPIISKALDWL